MNLSLNGCSLRRTPWERPSTSSKLKAQPGEISVTQAASSAYQEEKERVMDSSL
jgi:hypothetical protein